MDTYQEGAKPPKTLYIYHKYNDETISCLLSGKLWASGPEKFNDPFDCHVDLIDDYGVDVKGFHKKAKEILQSDENLTKHQIQNHLIKIENNNKYKDEFLKIYNDAIQEISKKFGVICFCATSKNSLMWSHYANKHYGFCVGYTSPTNKDVSEYGIGLFSVDYRKPRVINLSDYSFKPGKDMYNTAKTIFSLKHKSWGYEKEWRFVTRMDYCDKAVPLSCKIKEICFGLRMPEWQEKSIIHLLRDQQNRKDIKFYKMKIEVGEWNVKPESYTLK